MLLLGGGQLSTSEKMVMTVGEIVKVLIDSHSEGKEVNINKYVRTFHFSVEFHVINGFVLVLFLSSVLLIINLLPSSLLVNI